MCCATGARFKASCLPNVYFLPTAGTTPTSQVNGTVLYFQSKCRATPSSPEQTESIGWLDLYPTLTTESLAINHTGGCGFPDHTRPYCRGLGVGADHQFNRDRERATR